MSVFPSSQATIDLQMLPTFPANVVATGAVDISKSGLTYTFGLNFQNVIEETNVSDLGKRELLAQDTDTGAFWRIKLSNLLASSHTHPVSQISDATPLGQALVTAADAAAARAAIGADVLGGFRNKLINGNFDIWQRGTSQTSDGYGSDDRWINGHNGYTKTHSRQSFTLGQTDVPGNPQYFSRTEITVAGSAASNYCNKRQRIEGVRTLAGKTVTVTFWAKADSNRNIAVELVQNFGTGGTPSSDVTGIGVTTCALTTSWQKFSFTASLPSISGKTFGSNANDYLGLQFWFGAGSDYNARANSLGHQTGIFDIARVSLVEGDATAEYDPFSPRHIQQEIDLCQRYFSKSYQLTISPGTITSSGSFAFGSPANSGSGITYSFDFPNRMRASPTVTIFAPDTGTPGNVSVFNGSGTINLPVSVDNINQTRARLIFTFPEGYFDFRGHFTADAEL